MKNLKNYKAFLNEKEIYDTFTFKKMEKNIVEPLLGKDYITFIEDEDEDFQRQYIDIKKAYNVKKDDWKSAGWTQIYKSDNTQEDAWTCPEKEIIVAKILNNNNLITSLFMKPEKIKK